ncbi:hypothetical protein KDH83_27160 [Achromobacter sp. Marseille-Q0513]|uniref:hypothetical protein n=1 Tax=Achromobacter sp. Marseille-Q0513 TaxID=2829161 RepID=UPI001B9259EB|nr:hypothetical protein [Achromobacter sp. Marseille-Q0513]MBR8657002.1 hypothetical protein [Achromobacter sp. Marseille-Q0513]
MSRNVETLEQAVEEFFSSLNDAEKNALRQLFLTTREANSRRWMTEVVAMFGLDQPDCKLCADIERIFPEESVFKGRVFDNADGLFEAGIILREAMRRC